MSKHVFTNRTGLEGFASMLGKVPESAISSNKMSGTARLKVGMQAMYDEAKAEGYQAGLLEGKVIGKQQGNREAKDEFQAAHRSEIEKFHLALQAFVERAQESVESWYEEAEEALATLSIEIARRAIGQELSLSRDSIIELTKQALQEVRSGTDVRVRVNPVDASILESHREEILAGVAGIRGLEVVPDLHISGGCEIETDGGVVDARIQSYLARIAQEAA